MRTSWTGLLALSLLLLAGCPGVTEEDCSNGVDDDGDGLVDCDDPTCDLACQVDEDCGDGIDNDADGQTDCDDDDCDGDPACAPAEVCGDGLDNDEDGDIDCDDADCADDPSCADEICDDGIDNDGDASIDCDDADCIDDPACPPPDEVCDDGLDNDGDGAVDCNDDDCVGDPACVADQEDNCDDGLDEDGDGLIDCADSDCDGTAVCCPVDVLEPNDEVAAATPVVLVPGEPLVFEDLTASDLDPDWFSFSAAPGCDLSASLLFLHHDGDLDLFLYHEAGDELLSSETDSDNESVEWTNTAELPTGLTLRVLGLDPTCNDYQLRLLLSCPLPESELDCDDGLDDDGDGLVDCDDDDCEFEVRCLPETVCDDEVDDDFDGLTDCDDPDCEFETSCFCVADAEEPDDSIAEATDLGALADGDLISLADRTVDSVSSDDWYRFTVPDGCRALLASTFEHDLGDVDLSLRDPSDGFLASSASSTDNESLVWLNDTGAEAEVFARSYLFSGDCNRYDLDISVSCATPEDEVCDDGIDNDIDLDVDCDDADCADLGICSGIESVCDDGLDGDGDGLIDCDDEDCTFAPPCAPDCGPDSYEPNDSTGEATPLGALVDGDSVSFIGELTVEDISSDFFSLSVPADCRILADISFLHGLGDVDLQLLDESGSMLESSATVADAESIIWLNDTGASATYYLTPFLWSGTCNAYDLNVVVDCAAPAPEDCGDGLDNDFDGATDCADSDCEDAPACIEACDNGVDDDGDGDIDCDDDECSFDAACFDCPDDDLEPNDELAGAAELGEVDDLGLTLDDRVLSGGSEDWYAVSVAPGCHLTVEAGFVHADGDIDLSLSSATGEVLDSSASVTDAELVTWFNHTEAEATVYVRVYFWDGSCSSYSLTASRDCTPPPDEICDDFIDNDLDGRADCADGDCVGDAECAGIEFCEDGADNDEDGLIDCEDEDCLTDPACLAPCLPDGLEPNDALVEARELGLLTDGTELSYELTVEDVNEDWFSWTLPVGCQLELTAEFVDAVADLDLELLSDLGGVLDASAGVDDSEQVSWLNDGAGAATVVARAYLWSGSCLNYTLSANVSCSASPEDCSDGADNDLDGATDCADSDCAEDAACVELDCEDGIDSDNDLLTDCDDIDCVLDPACVACTEDDALEPNDEIAMAVPLALPGTESDLAATDTSDDYFAFTVPGDCFLALSLSFSHADGDIDLELLNDAGLVLADSSSESDDESLVWTNEGAGDTTVYAHVELWSGSCNVYTLDAALACP